MSKPEKNQWKNICKFLAEYMTPNDSYKAGDLYESYLKNHPLGYFEDPIAKRKDFEMCLRYEVEKENGFLKRVSHGVYAIRTDSQISTKGFSLDELLDNSVGIAEKCQLHFLAIENQELPINLQLHLANLKSDFMYNIDKVITNITALIAWCEDNVEYCEKESEMQA